MSKETRSQSIARLFKIPLKEVEILGDTVNDFENLLIFGQRPSMLAYSLPELETLLDPQWIVEGWVPSGMTAVYAKPKGGKTFWVMTLAICYAMGIPFFNLKVVGSGKVLYIAAEGSGKANWRRIERIAKALGVDMDELRKRLFVVTSAVHIDDPQKVDDFLLLNPGQWDLVVIDTLARCMVGDESATVDMNIAVAGMDYLRRNVQATGLIVIHHQGHKNDRMRGSIALLGAVDAQIRAQRLHGGVIQVIIEELREAAVPKECGIAYRLNPGTGALEHLDTPTPAENLEGREGEMWKVLAKLDDVSNGSGVAFKEWAAALDKLSPDLLAPAPGKKALSAHARYLTWRRLAEHMVHLGSVNVSGKGRAKRYRPHRAMDDFKADDDDTAFEPG